MEVLDSISNVITDEIILNSDKDEEHFRIICHICKMNFVKFNHLKLHCLDEHETKPEVKCFSCKKLIQSEKLMRIHRRIHAPSDSDPAYSCLICNSKFATDKGLAQHLIYHDEAQKKTPKPENEICETCGVVVGRSKLAAHYRDNHMSYEEKKLIMLSCDLCDKLLPNKSHMSMHMISKHINLKSNECQVCHKKYSTFIELKRHSDTHNTEDKYLCDICCKGFKIRRHFQVHRAAHFEARYKCNICDQGFYKKEKYDLHMSKFSYYIAILNYHVTYLK